MAGKLLVLMGTFVIAFAGSGTALAQQPSPPQLTSFTAVDPSVTMPAPATVRATISQQVSNYRVAIYNADTGALVSACASTTCYGSISNSWHQNDSPPDRTFTARIEKKVGGVWGPDGGSAGPVTVDVQRYEWEVELVAESASVTMPTPAKVTATLDYRPSSTGYRLAIYRTDTGALVTACALHIASCTGTITPAWHQNGDPPTYPFKAVVEYSNSSYPNNHDVAGQSSVVSVEVEPREWDVVTSSPGPVSVPSPAVATGTIEYGPSSTGYRLAVYDVDTGALVTACALHLKSCTGSIANPWSVNGAPPTRRFRFDIEFHSTAYPNNHHVAGSAEIDVDVETTWFPVDLTFGAGQTQFDGSELWPATAHSYNLESSPYVTQVRDVDSGVLVEACVSEMAQCGPELLGEGTYVAVIGTLDGTEVYGSSGVFTIDEDGPHEDVVGGVSLQELAALFGGTSAICNALLSYPGTHFQGTSTSDQWNTCDLAAQAGYAEIRTLLAILAGVGGSAAVITWLSYYAQDERSDSGDVNPVPPDPTPPGEIPSNPPGSGSTSSLAADLIARNPGADLSVSWAKDIIEVCQNQMARASKPADRCEGALPMFITGDLDFPKATELDRDAIIKRPQWAILTYESRQAKIGRGLNPSWYNTAAGDGACAGAASGEQCHEYPYFASEEGWQGMGSGQRPALRPIPGAQNFGQGNAYGRFLRNCFNYQPGSRFLVIPAPKNSGIPTLTKVCNGG